MCIFLGIYCTWLKITSTLFITQPFSLRYSQKTLHSLPRPHFYQTRSAWSMDQGSIRKHSTVHNFASTVAKFCVVWEGLSLPHDTKFGNCRGEIVDRRVIFNWALILGSSWSGLIKVGPGGQCMKRPLWIHSVIYILHLSCIAVLVVNYGISNTLYWRYHGLPLQQQHVLCYDSLVL